MALPALVGTLLVPILVQVLKLVTPALRGELVEFVQGYTARAYATSNRWDDVFAKLLAALVSVDISGVQVQPTDEPMTDAIVGALVGVATGQDPFAPPGNELGGA